MNHENLERHFTATTYILDRKNKRTLLHWHNKLSTYLPPGGHLENNEAPYDAAIREIEEEYGLINLEFIHPNKTKIIDERSYSLEMPHFLISEKIAKNHIHLDWIFYSWMNENNSIDYKITATKWFTKDDLIDEKYCFDNVRDLALYGLDNFY